MWSNKNIRKTLLVSVTLILALEGIFFTIYYEDGFSILLTTRVFGSKTRAEKRFCDNVKEANEEGGKYKNFNVIYIDVSQGFLNETRPSEELIKAGEMAFQELSQTGLMNKDQKQALKNQLGMKKTMSSIIQLILLKQIYDLKVNGSGGLLEIWIFAETVDIMSSRQDIGTVNFDRLINVLSTQQINASNSIHTDFINLFNHPFKYGEWPKKGKVNMTVISDFIQSTQADGNEVERRDLVKHIKELKNLSRLSLNFVHLGDKDPKKPENGDWSIFSALDKNLVRKSFYTEPDISSNHLSLKGLTYPEVKFDDPIIVQYDILNQDSLVFIMDFDLADGGDDYYIRLGRNEYDKGDLPLLDVRYYRVDSNYKSLKGNPIILSRGIPIEVFLDVDQKLLLAYSGSGRKMEKLMISSSKQQLNYAVDVFFKEKPRPGLKAIIIFNIGVLIILVLYSIVTFLWSNFGKPYFQVPKEIG